jgi:hypothetical protein
MIKWIMVNENEIIAEGEQFINVTKGKMQLWYLQRILE